MKNVPIIALCTLIIANCAEGAKLCRKNAFAGVNSGAYSVSNKIWAAGTGCGQNAYGNTDGKKESITDPAQLCGTGTRIVSGQTSCKPSADFHYFAEDLDLTADSGGDVCWCRVTWPFTGPWIPIMTVSNATSGTCNFNCGIRCALQDYGLRTAFLGV